MQTPGVRADAVEGLRRTTVRLLATICLLAAANIRAQDVLAPSPPAGRPAPAIGYVNGELKIDVIDSTLGDVLAKVADVTGAKLDLPQEARAERVGSAQLGPGSPRQVLTALLSGCGFDYVVLGSSESPGKIESILLMAKVKAGPPTDVHEARSIFARRQRQDETSSAAAVSPAQPTGLETSAPVQTPPGQTDSPEPPNATKITDRLHQNDSIVNRPGAMSPPATLNAQAMSQQLQQMYEQRKQMMQQDRQPGVSSTKQ